ncbi:hypothetical protein RRG08_033569 [Elysia crispata]|uniref:Uncharacterized protein n=1 Tax=Elysia crispata TaxID=231223 RepID=A0AAE0XNX0_9GAST|nr:hypothetical protein RRG08_033569 [Elysia crispata]
MVIITRRCAAWIANLSRRQTTRSWLWRWDPTGSSKRNLMENRDRMLGIIVLRKSGQGSRRAVRPCQDSLTRGLETESIHFINQTSSVNRGWADSTKIT